MLVLKSLQYCDCIDSTHFCCLCFLQVLSQYPPSVSVLHDPSSLVYSHLNELPPTLPDFQSLMNTFTTIGGNSQLKQYLMESIINPALYQEVILSIFFYLQKYAHFHIQPPTGILLYGPPGTGKTAICRACSQLGSFNFICPEISELICKEVGESERRIRELFAKAKKASPCILFFDEIESIFKNRNNSETSSNSNQLLTQLLLQIDLVNEEHSDMNNGSFVFIIGATNLPNVDYLHVILFVAFGSFAFATRKTG